MDTLILFLVKSIVVSGLLTAWYCVALRNRQLHNYNRFFLLFTLYASIQVPMFHFQWFTVDSAPAALVSPAAFLLNTVNLNGAGAQGAVQAASGIAINWPVVAMVITGIVSFVLVTVLLLRIVQVVRMSRKYPCRFVDGTHVIDTDLPRAPFSFMNWMFWRDTIAPDSANGRLIFQHELTHIRQKHTYDKLASQLLTCIFWMNPFYWFIQKELGMVHEFIADEQALSGGDTEAFALMLLATHSNGTYFNPEHQFFSSPIKRRLTMLQITGKTSRFYARRLAVLPLAACTVLIFSFAGRKESKPTIVKADKKIVLVVDAGHGGNDVGCSNGWLTEKQLNLKIARRIKDLAQDYNIEVHLTRDKDEYISLSDRVAISNKLHPDDFISIHVNDLPGNDIGNGSFDIAVNSKNPKAEQSKQLAYAIYRQVARPEWVQRSAPTEKSLYVLRDNTVPALLIEFGDIKNKQQMELLTNNGKLDELCGAVLRGVVQAHKD